MAVRPSPPPPPPSSSTTTTTTTTTTPPTQGTTTFAPPTNATQAPTNATQAPTQRTSSAPTQSSAAPTQGTTTPATKAPTTNATLAPTQRTTTFAPPTNATLAPTQRTTTPATKAPTTTTPPTLPPRETTTFFPGGNSTFNPTLPPQIGGGGSGSGGAAVGAAIGGLLVVALAIIAFVIFKTRQRVGPQDEETHEMTLNPAHASRRTSVQFPNAAKAPFKVADLSQETRNFASSLLPLDKNTSFQYINPRDIKRIALFNLEGIISPEKPLTTEAAPLDQIEEAIRIQQDYIQALRYYDYPTTDLNGNLNKFITDYQKAFEILDSLFVARITMKTVQKPEELTGEYLQVTEDAVSVVSASGVPVTTLNPEYFTVESLTMYRKASYELVEKEGDAIYATAESFFGSQAAQQPAAAGSDPRAGRDVPLEESEAEPVYENNTAGNPVNITHDPDTYDWISDQITGRHPTAWTDPSRGYGLQAAVPPATAAGFDPFANYDTPLRVEQQPQGFASEYTEVDELFAGDGSQAAVQPATAAAQPQRRATLWNSEDAAGYPSMETLGRQMRVEGNYVPLTQQGAGTEGQPLYDQTAPQTGTIRSVDFGTLPETNPQDPAARQASTRQLGGRSPSASGSESDGEYV